MPARKTKRQGGRRAGAGRKPADPSGRKKPLTVWVSPAEREHLEALGGTAPAGLRRLLAGSMGR
jgi:hypothetical protein